MDKPTINILDIMRGTTVDGPGFRTSIYVAGCRHACPGCHNPQSWDFASGTPMTIEEILAIIDEEDFDVTLSGGDPLYNPEFMRNLSEAVKSRGHNVWLYTGFLWENIMASPVLKDAIKAIDVIVDGPFIESLRDTDLLFRGSSNQRLIDVAASLSEGKVIEWKR